MPWVRRWLGDVSLDRVRSAPADQGPDEADGQTPRSWLWHTDRLARDKRHTDRAA